MQLALLTATVKLFLKRPVAGGELVPKVLKWATEEVDNPDCRDRGFMYWRMLSTDPAAARQIVLAEKPPISTETDRMDRQLLDQLLLQSASLASIFHRQPQTFIRGSKARYMPDSPALDETARRHASAHLFSKPHTRTPLIPSTANGMAAASAATSQPTAAVSATTSGAHGSTRDQNGEDNGASFGDDEDSTVPAASAFNEANEDDQAGEGKGRADNDGVGNQDAGDSSGADPYSMLGDDFGGANGGYALDNPAPRTQGAMADLLA